MALRVVDRIRGSKWVQALPAGSVALQSAGNPADSQNSGTPMYGSRIRRQDARQQVEPGPARWGSGGARSDSGASPSQTESAMPTRVFRKFRKTEEISRSNVWRLVSCSIRRQQVGAGTACPGRFALSPFGKQVVYAKRSEGAFLQGVASERFLEQPFSRGAPRPSSRSGCGVPAQAPPPTGGSPPHPDDRRSAHARAPGR